MLRSVATPGTNPDVPQLPEWAMEPGGRGIPASGCQQARVEGMELEVAMITPGGCKVNVGSSLLLKAA